MKLLKERKTFTSTAYIKILAKLIMLARSYINSENKEEYQISQPNITKVILNFYDLHPLNPICLTEVCDSLYRMLCKKKTVYYISLLPLNPNCSTLVVVEHPFRKSCWWDDNNDEAWWTKSSAISFSNIFGIALSFAMSI